MMERKIRLELNGKTFEGDISVHLTLLEFLREKMGLKGIKEGCGSGDCGACTVLLNGFPVNSCLVLAVETDGQSVTTIEGLCQDEKMSEMQQAFVAHGAVQCGYCSPGMVMTAEGLLAENPDPTKEEVKRALAGNLCRCTGYQRIIKAVLDVAQERKKRFKGGGTKTNKEL